MVIRLSIQRVWHTFEMMQLWHNHFKQCKLMPSPSPCSFINRPEAPPPNLKFRQYFGLYSTYVSYCSRTRPHKQGLPKILLWVYWRRADKTVIIQCELILVAVFKYLGLFMGLGDGRCRVFIEQWILLVRLSFKHPGRDPNISSIWRHNWLQ